MSQITIPEAQAIQAIIEPLASKRLRCWFGLIELLKTVTKANGYSLDTVEVDADQKDWGAVPAHNCPRLEVFLNEQNMVKHAGCVREYTYDFVIYGLTRDIDLQAFEIYVADVEQCINDNNSLVGQANKMEVSMILTDQQFFPRVDKARMFAMTVQVETTRTARQAR